jgi:acyl-CoA dehydrogenase
MPTTDAPILMPLGEDFPEIRESVRAICAGFPGDYWRGLEDGDAYPEAFVKALTEAGYLAALIPEEYGGSGLPLRAAAVILEEIHASGCNAGACHAQMYIMGTVLRHGSAEQKKRYLPEIASGRLRLQAFGVTEPTTGSDTTRLKTRAVRDGAHYVITGQKVWISRALNSDLMLLLARTKPLEQCTKRSDGLSVFLLDLRDALGKGLEIRKLPAMINHNTTEIFFDGLRVPADSLIGEENKGFRYILDGMNAERILIAAEALGDARFFVRKAAAYAAERVVFDRPIGENQGVQFRGALRRRARVRRGSQHRQDARFRSELARGRGCDADPRRFRLRTRIRRGAQMARDAPLPDRPHLHQPDPVLHRRARAGHAALLLT